MDTPQSAHDCQHTPPQVCDIEDIWMAYHQLIEMKESYAPQRDALSSPRNCNLRRATPRVIKPPICEGPDAHRKADRHNNDRRAHERREAKKCRSALRNHASRGRGVTRGKQYSCDIAGDGPEPGPPKCTHSECVFGVRCNRISHFHWANNKGEGKHDPAKIRILRKKARSAVLCKHEVTNDQPVCPRLNCHCHPVPKGKDAPKDAFAALVGVPCAEAIDASRDCCADGDGGPAPFEEEEEEEKETKTKLPDLSHALKVEIARRARRLEEEEMDAIMAHINIPRAPALVPAPPAHNPPHPSEIAAKEAAEAATKAKLLKAIRALKSPTLASTPPCPGPPKVDQTMAHVEAAIRHVRAKLKTPPTVAPEEIAVDHIDVPAYCGVSTMLKNSSASGPTPPIYSRQEQKILDSVMATTPCIIFTRDPNGSERRKWRTANEFAEDCKFWLYSHLSSVNEVHTVEEKEQIVVSQPMTKKSTTTLRYPRFRFRKRGVEVQYPEATVVNERKEDDHLNLFKGTYTHSHQGRAFTMLTEILTSNQLFITKVALDAGGKIRSTFSKRVKDMLVKEHSLKLGHWLSTPESRWIFEQTVAHFVNHAVLSDLYTNLYGTQAPISDRPMENGSKVPSSPTQRSKNRIG